MRGERRDVQALSRHRTLVFDLGGQSHGHLAPVCGVSMIRAVLACDGREGHFPCKQATPTGVVDSGAQARTIARRDGWTHKIYSGKVLDLCPACTLRLSLGKLSVGVDGLAS